MRRTRLPIPLIGSIAVTRAMLGSGLTLLLGDRIPARHRRPVGFILTAIGAATTIPLLLAVRSRAT